MGLSAKSFASLENIRAPKVSTIQTKIVLKKEMSAFRISIFLVLVAPMNEDGEPSFINYSIYSKFKSVWPGCLALNSVTFIS